MNVHFYWKEPENIDINLGLGWQFLNRLTLISHVVVGHKPIIWLDSKEPLTNKYWISDIPNIIIKNKSETRNILKTSEFYEMEKSNPRTASTLFSYEIVKRTGEYYADTDAIALKKWPNVDYLLAGSEPEYISVGVLKLPKNHPVLTCAQENILAEWGNVKIFTSCCRKMGLDNNVPIDWFYPVHWKDDNYSYKMKCKGKFLDNIQIPKHCFSYHYYSNKVSKVGIDHTWIKKPELKNSLFLKWVKRYFKKYTVLNREIVKNIRG